MLYYYDRLLYRYAAIPTTGVLVLAMWPVVITSSTTYNEVMTMDDYCQYLNGHYDPH